MAILLIALMACTSTRVGSPSREPNAMFSPIDPTYADLERMIAQEPKMHRIDQLLGKLKEKYPYYLEGATFVYDTHSVHESSALNPRVLLYGHTARMILTFNGSDQQKNYSKLELVHFLEGEKKFEFREIDFNEDNTPGRPGVKIMPPGKLSSRSDITCFSCHGEKSPRPLWEPYFLWPGVYGSSDDHIYQRTLGLSPDVARDQLRDRIDKQAPNQVEYDKLLAFFEAGKSNLRYQPLVDAFDRFLGVTTKNDHHFRKNLLLTRRLNYLNGQRVAQNLLKDFKMQMFLPFILSQSLCRQFKIDAFLPLSMAQSAVNRLREWYAKIEAFRTAEERKVENRNQAKIEKDHLVGPGNFLSYSRMNALPELDWALVFWQALQPNNDEWMNWTMALNHEFAFDDGFAYEYFRLGFSFYLAKKILPPQAYAQFVSRFSEAEVDESLANKNITGKIDQLFSTKAERTQADPEAECKALQDQSRRALGNMNL